MLKFVKEIQRVKHLVNALQLLVMLTILCLTILWQYTASSTSVAIASFATVIGALVGIANASFGLGFSISHGIAKKANTTRKKKNKHNKIVLIAKSKLNSIENIISKALIDNKISHEQLTTIINEAKNYRNLKESIKMMKSQRSDIRNWTDKIW